jgi:hypothetical protein
MPIQTGPYRYRTQGDDGDHPRGLVLLLGTPAASASLSTRRTSVASWNSPGSQPSHSFATCPAMRT